MNRSINGRLSSLTRGFRSLRLPFVRGKITPFGPKKTTRLGNGFSYHGKQYIHHSTIEQSQSAFHRLTGRQILIILNGLLLAVVALLLNWHLAIVAITAILTSLYFADLLFNLYLVRRSFSRKVEISVKPSELKKFDPKNAPVYTILCPLYKEWQILPQFVTAMSRMDYPKNKLQVLLLLEEDDTESIRHIKKYNLPSYFQTVIVPHSFPKTKPKACNYGLAFAKGEYVVIYDAEDVPDRDQLKKSVIAFSHSEKNVVCMQAKLNFYNPRQNLLTRAFTAEYSLWFDLVLTGLQSINAPIPLGGTSNHFRTKDLKALHGWDSFNVTEDCDLGMRLSKNGLRTMLLDSVTLEEASSQLSNWFWQRTRWIKGYMQTYLVHMRDPRAFATNYKKPDLLTFQLVVGGKVFSTLINPFMWLVTFAYFAFRTDIGLLIESFFPTPVLYMGVIALFLGNFLYLYYYLLGCVRHGHHDLAKYVFLIPFYWLLMSAAAWVALYKLLTAPHHWSKTKHGIHLKSESSIAVARSIIGSSLIDRKIAFFKGAA